MEVHGRLVAVVAAATSPTEALTAATRVIAEALQAEACSIFAERAGRGLELCVHFGPYRTIGASLAEKAFADVLPATDAVAGLAAVPVAAINHAIGAVVVRRATAPFTTEELMRLSGIASQLVDLVGSVRLMEAIQGAPATDQPVKAIVSSPAGERVLRGLAASPGIEVGVAAFHRALPRGAVRAEGAYRGKTIEEGRARDAFEKTRNDLLLLQAEAASEIGEEQALIFGAHLLLLNDPMFAGLVDGGIADGRAAGVAVDDAFDEIVRRLLDVSDPYVQERVEDLEDLRSRILGHLVGAARVPVLDARIVVSARTTPSLLIELKARGAVGIASELGGVTSHGVVLARALGIPAVTGIRELTREVVAGDELIVDGAEGIVIVRPTAETRAVYAARSREAERRRTEFARYRDQPARTADGFQFELRANIALGADLELARDNRADGVGLYRTEFPFIVRDALPSIDEQVRIYAKAYDTFPHSQVTFRLLDLAGDKFLPSTGFGGARSAFHGYRSIRILFDYPHILRDQVQAFAIAAGGRPLRILIPMVTSVNDLVRIKGLIAAALEQAARVLADIRVIYGAMIETPAAVELVTDLAREVEFFSIGTNDLIQYTLVVDREDPRITSDRHPYHPAILRMIRRVVLEAHRAGKSVTVCGEMAARAELALALLAMDIDGLSVTPRVIPELKRALALMYVEPLRARIDEILALSTDDDVTAALRRNIAVVSSSDVSSRPEPMSLVADSVFGYQR
jgi:phosphotransferase system, enzyme I, PtsP